MQTIAPIDGLSMRQSIRRVLQADGRGRNYVRCREDVAEYRVDDPTGAYWITTQSDAMRRQRQQQRAVMHSGGTILQWYGVSDGTLVPACETLQANAPTAMRVRSIASDAEPEKSLLCIFAGSWTRAEVAAYPDEIATAIRVACSEASALERRGYRLGSQTPAQWWEFRDGHRRVSKTIASIIEANMRHGIPLRTAARHALRAGLPAGEEPREQRVHNLVRQAQRALKRPTRASPDAGDPTGESEATLRAAAGGGLGE